MDINKILNFYEIYCIQIQGLGKRVRQREGDIKIKKKNVTVGKIKNKYLNIL